MVKVSILMAVYNTAEYLPQCLDSLLDQTMGDFQVICVDDASTDDSLKVLESYAHGDSRIEVISLAENHGQAFARNQGLMRAQGTYTCFLDSDDWLGKDALQQIVSAFEQDETIDSVLFRCRYYYSEDRIEEYPMPAFEKKEKKDKEAAASVDGQPVALSCEQAFELSLTWKIHGVYAVKTSIHLQYPYDDSSRSYSDDNTTRLHYLASRKVVSCGGAYFYRQHAASAHLLNVYENERWKNVVGIYLFHWQHAHELADADRREGLHIIRNTWKSIDFRMIFPENKNKLGFLPCRSSLLPEGICWRLFRLQANLYFLLKKISGKI